MAHQLTMPKLGLTMTEGTISKWNKQEGDAVNPGDVLFVVSTDKLTYEYRAEEQGILLRINAASGSSVPVGCDVGWIGQLDEALPESTLPLETPATEPSAPTEERTPARRNSSGKKRVVVMGGGPGGYVCAIRLAQLGADITVVEKGRLGGTCLNVGCIPTKVLVHTSELMHQLSQGASFGLTGPMPPLDWAALQARKNAVVTQLTDGVAGLLAANGVSVVAGQGHFTSPRSIDVQGQSLEADAFVVATGSSPVIPPIPGIDHRHIATSTEALSFDKIPERLVVVGGGVIGLEFACIYATLGSSVTVVEMMPTILPLADDDIIAVTQRRLEALGIKFHSSSKVTAFEGRDDGVIVSVETPQGPLSLDCSKVLLSIGRRPNTNGLNLESAGVKTERNRIVVNRRMETSAPGIYAIGDCCSPVMLAHVASTEGEIAAENIMGHSKEMSYSNVPSCVFTQPEIAWTGLTERDARARGHDVVTGTFPLLANGRSLIMNDTDGLVKLVVDRRYKEILGVHIIGPRATDLIIEGALALRLEATVDELTSTIHGHPTLGEALGEAALAVENRAIHLPPTV